MVQEKGPKSGDSSPEKNMTCPSSISGSTYRNTKVGGKGRRDLLSHSGKEDMGESTDVQSTGFSVHGDSGRGPGSTGKEFFFFRSHPVQLPFFLRDWYFASFIKLDGFNRNFKNVKIVSRRYIFSGCILYVSYLLGIPFFFLCLLKVGLHNFQISLCCRGFPFFFFF